MNSTQPTFRYPPKPRPGDRIAVLSPSSGSSAVLRAVGEYNPSAPVVLGLDIGHTDPQPVIPNGGRVTVDAVRHRVVVRY